MFIGSDGIRAGWRIVLFCLLAIVFAVALTVAIGLAVYLLGHDVRIDAAALKRGVFSPSLVVFSEGSTGLAALFAAWIMARIERRNFRAYGLAPERPAQRLFAEGALAGFAAMSLALLAVLLCGDLHFIAPRATGVSDRLSDALAWALAFGLTGLSEEFIFRGYLLYTLGCGMRFPLAAVLTSAAFGAAHLQNAGETPLGIVNVAVFGGVLCFVLQRTGTLWFGIGMHGAWDWAQTYLYGVPDSGATTSHTLFHSVFSGPAWLSGLSAGPEGGIATDLALAAVALYVALRFRGPLRSTTAEPLRSEPL